MILMLSLAIKRAASPAGTSTHSGEEAALFVIVSPGILL